MKKLFEKILLLVMVMIPVGLTSCGGSDDDTVSTGNSSIVGTWEQGEQTYLEHKCTMRIVFNSNNTGVMTADYTDGTDPYVANFEYVLKVKENEETTVTIVWTGTTDIRYNDSKEYPVTITPTRLVLGDYTYTRK